MRPVSLRNLSYARRLATRTGSGRAASGAVVSSAKRLSSGLTSEESWARDAVRVKPISASTRSPWLYPAVCRRSEMARFSVRPVDFSSSARRQVSSRPNPCGPWSSFRHHSFIRAANMIDPLMTARSKSRSRVARIFGMIVLSLIVASFAPACPHDSK